MSAFPQSDDLCSSILAKFEQLRLSESDDSTTESEDEHRNREQFLKELITQEIKQQGGDIEMESQEQRERR